MKGIDPSSLLRHVRTRTTQSIVSKTHFVTKSITQLTNWQGRKIVVGGFAAGANANVTKARALSELCERVFALYDFQANHLIDGQFMRTTNWPANEKVYLVDGSAIVLGPTPFSESSSSDASGLSWASNFDRACMHAFFEVLERHLLAEIWYRGRSITKLDRRLIGEFSADVYTVPTERLVPFALAVLSDRFRQRLVCGSAVRSSLIDAIEHSISEAIMLMDGVLRQDIGSITNESTRARVLSLSNHKLSIARWQYIERQVDRTERSATPLRCLGALDDILKAIFNGSEPELQIANLYSSDQGHLVRALIPKALHLNVARATIPCAIPDPFC